MKRWNKVMESRHESIFIDNLTQEEKEKIEKVIKEVKPDVYILIKVTV